MIVLNLELDNLFGFEDFKINFSYSDDIKNSSIKDFDISTSDGFYITEENHKRLKRSSLNEDDVLFTTIGHVGSSAIVPKGFVEANMNQNFVKIEIDKNKISPYYILAYLNSKIAR